MAVTRICGAQEGAKRGKAIRFAAAAFSIILAVGTPLAAITAPGESYADPSTAQQLADVQSQAAAAEARLGELTEQLEDADAELYAIQTQQAEVQAQVEQTKVDIAAAQERVGLATESLNASVADQYRASSNSMSALVEVLTSSNSLDEMFTGIVYAQRISSSQQERVDEYVAARAELEAQQAALETQSAELAELEAQASAKQAEIAAAVSEQQSYYNGLSAEVQELVAQRDAEAAAQAQVAAQAQATEEAPAADEEPAATTSSTSSSSSSSASTSSSSSSSSSSSTPATTSTVSRSISSSTRYAALAYAESKIGCWYVYGAEGPDTFDCSGLTMCAYESAGVSLSHHAASQMYECSSLFYDESQAEPGDLVFFRNGGHVGIYCGNGTYIHAPQTGKQVCYASLSSRSSYVFGAI